MNLTRTGKCHPGSNSGKNWPFGLMCVVVVHLPSLGGCALGLLVELLVAHVNCIIVHCQSVIKQKF